MEAKEQGPYGQIRRRRQRLPVRFRKADALIISGYDNDGDVLLGYSPFMDVEHDHSEPHDRTGYFRKSGWHEGLFAEAAIGRILIIGDKMSRPPKEEILASTLELATHLIGDDVLVEGQHNGLAAHRAFAGALLTYTWDDNFEPYLNTMCNYKQYIDRQYAAKYLHESGGDDLAAYFDEIGRLSERMGRTIPQDFSAGDLFGDRANLRPYAKMLLKIADLEEAFWEQVRQTESRLTNRHGIGPIWDTQGGTWITYTARSRRPASLSQAIGNLASPMIRFSASYYQRADLF